MLSSRKNSIWGSVLAALSIGTASCAAAQSDPESWAAAKVSDAIDQCLPSKASMSEREASALNAGWPTFERRNPEVPLAISIQTLDPARPLFAVALEFGEVDLNPSSGAVALALDCVVYAPPSARRPAIEKLSTIYPDFENAQWFGVLEADGSLRKLSPSEMRPTLAEMIAATTNNQRFIIAKITEEDGMLNINTGIFENKS